MPINLATINSFFGVNLTPSEAGAFLESKRVKIANPRNLEEKAISLVGRELYEAFIRGYTKKQWACEPTQLPAGIITRLPVRTSFFDSYFDDTYQGIPAEGYTRIFERMLEGIPVELGVDFHRDRGDWMKKARKVVYTGPIDRYFDYALGRLNWRSVRFETERLKIDDYQGTSVMNYADEDTPHTRIHEPKHLHLERPWNKTDTVIMREYAHADDEAPYYPVNSESDRALYEKYAAMEAAEKNVIFGGRLARYKYYDMHQVIGAALVAAKRELAGQ
jgi:UDP-galactopyranose mutase